MSQRVLVHVQHLVGTGHQRRAAALARALEARGLAVVYVTGGFPVPGLDTGGAEVVQLAPARAADLRFDRLVAEDGRPVDEAWKALRRDAVLGICERLRPDALVIETYPFGRRLLRFELEPMLDLAWSRARRPLILSSVRDILEPRDDAARNRGMARTLRARFDAVLVHGDPDLTPLQASFPLAGEIEDLTHYTGYLLDASRDAAPGGVGAGEVLVSAGGGKVGAALLRAVLEARDRSALADHQWRILAGADLPAEDLAALAALAGEGAIVERHRNDFPARLRNCALSISQAGYNTLLEVVRSGARALVVPHSAGGEREQSLRAACFERQGLVCVLEAAEASPVRLAAAIDAAASRTPPQASGLRFDGAERAARFVSDALTARVHA